MNWLLPKKRQKNPNGMTRRSAGCGSVVAPLAAPLELCKGDPRRERLTVRDPVSARRGTRFSELPARAPGYLNVNESTVRNHLSSRDLKVEVSSRLERYAYSHLADDALYAKGVHNRRGAAHMPCEIKPLKRLERRNFAKTPWDLTHSVYLEGLVLSSSLWITPKAVSRSVSQQPPQSRSVGRQLFRL